MGIPIPSHLTPTEADACDAFSQAVWGQPLFDRQPSHNGRHGWSCDFCSVVLRRERKQPARQPWELAA